MHSPALRDIDKLLKRLRPDPWIGKLKKSPASVRKYELCKAHYIGGSIASSAFGIARATIDIDIVSDLQPRNVDSFVEILKKDYYVDKEMLSDAIRRRSSFNIIHLETMLKVDIFIAEDTPFYREIFKRRKKDTLEEKEGATEFYFASPEDIILKKCNYSATKPALARIDLDNVLSL